MSRTVILLGLAQVVSVICGFFALTIMLKHYGYPNQPYFFRNYNWTLLTLFLRRFGMVLLLVPLAWIVVSEFARRRGKLGLPYGVWLIIGTLIPLIMLAVFFYAIFHPAVLAS